MMDELKLPMCHLINASVCEEMPQITARIRQRGDEVIGHGYTNSERQSDMDEADMAGANLSGTDLSALSERERRMIPILIDAAACTDAFVGIFAGIVVNLILGDIRQIDDDCIKPREIALFRGERFFGRTVEADDRQAREAVSPVADIEFPEGTGGSGTATLKNSNGEWLSYATKSGVRTVS